MKKITLVASAIGLVLMGIAWLADAHLSQPLSPYLIYNQQAKVYQLHEQIPYASQPLEQKLLTLQSISRHESQFVTKDSSARH